MAKRTASDNPVASPPTETASPMYAATVNEFIATITGEGATCVVKEYSGVQPPRLMLVLTLPGYTVGVKADEVCF